MEIIKIFILLTVNYAICNKNDENAVVESVPKESRLQRKNIRFNEAYKPIIESFKRIRDDKVYDNRFQPSCILDKIIIERNYNSTQLKIKTIEKDLESLKAYKSQFSTKIAENKTKIEMYSYKMAEELDQFDENEPKLSDNVLDIISAIKAVKDENGFLMTMISKFDEMEANLLDRLVIYKNYSRDLGKP
ncbi:conserved hypothetical protein [Theileria orientalis strain Shintoku]|uniref:Uncharacterized protein n=1 Tax=Theileria orientalis strain Shintoku TaxID=869250 RepID=J4D7T3_THEOR|nr:conserved hypothetical protein [Theileria orientalis strain Shintoku]BAM40340.1 conserved hypothetical protein [Theileria orientalis strain Shintoku]|eukprot:XP_009690641.1 conserved hypothetical protein [Theileria orientalis strain Shintoku]